MSGAVTSMYSANALYLSLVMRAFMRAEALSSTDTTPTALTKRMRASIAVTTPLTSTGGACVARGVERVVLGDEAAAERML